GRFRPSRPAPPTRNSSRRDHPSQVRTGRPGIVSMMQLLGENYNTGETGLLKINYYLVMTTALLIIAGVTLFSAILFFGALRLWTHVERAERDAKYRRRWLWAAGLIYLFSVANGVIKLLSGAAPVVALLGLPIPLLMAWFFFAKLSARKSLRTNRPQISA